MGGGGGLKFTSLFRGEKWDKGYFCKFLKQRYLQPLIQENLTCTKYSKLVFQVRLDNNPVEKEKGRLSSVVQKKLNER